MPESKIEFGQWSDDLLDKTNISRDRAADVHTVIETWVSRTISGELAYRTLAAIYWSNFAHDSAETHWYQNDMMQRLAFDADLDSDQTIAIHSDTTQKI